MEHTKGELEYNGSCDNCIDIVSADDEAFIVAQIINEEADSDALEFANARHIVLCWNSHDKLQAKADCFDELVVACEKIMKEANKPAIHTQTWETQSKEWEKSFMVAYTVARQALAKAKKL